MYRFDIVTIVLTLTFAIDIVRAQSCFWPNGNGLTTSDDFVACGTEGHSQCCASGHACMSNGLCFNPAKGGVYRGGCTDKNWSTENCPRMCNDMSGMFDTILASTMLTSRSDFVGSEAPLAPCPPDANGNWKWWCGQDYTNVCGRPDKNTSIFDYPAEASIMRVAGIKEAAPSASASPVPIASATSVSSAQATPNTTRRDGETVAKFVPIAVGIGVGVPLAMLAITMGFFFWKERKRRIIAERLGYAGQAVAMAKQNYEVEITALKPALKHSASRSRSQRQPGRSRGNTA